MSSPRPVFQSRESRFIRYVLYGFLLCLTLSFITACDFAQTKRKKSNIAPPPFASEQAVPKEKIEEIAKPVNPEDGMSVKSVAINDGISQDREKIVTAGYKKDILFENNDLTTEERLKRLESAVQKISDKLIKLDPTIKRLAEIDNDLSLLTNQLEILVSQESSQGFEAPKHQEFQNVKAQPSKKNMAPKAQKMNEIIPAAGNSSFPIRGIRMSDHSDKTRIVFDSDQKMISQKMTQGENTLRVSMSQVIDLTDVSFKQSSDIIQDIQIEPNEKALLFIFDRKISIMKSEHIPPNTKVPYHRYYIDLN